MFLQLKNRLERELIGFLAALERRYCLKTISPLLAKTMRSYILRPGKRVRPILFIIGYRSFSDKNAPGLFTSALSLEILHDFLLIHDDIIDKATTRRGKPAMHMMFNAYLKKYPRAKFSGEDLAIVAGDIIYALAVESFLAIREDPKRKELALKKFVEAAFYTGCGEFIDTLCGAQPLAGTTINEIYRIYDFKTAYYTFAGPLTTGAILGGANDREVKKLFDYGMNLGRAFQIKDDILGIFAEEKETGKPALGDLQENKKTILLHFAYHHANPAQKRQIAAILERSRVTVADLEAARRIITSTGSRDNAVREIKRLRQKALACLESSRIKPRSKKILTDYSCDLLKT